MSTLPKPLVDQVRNGRVVLVFGAGASIGAMHPEGKKIPIGSELKDQIGNKFITSYNNSYDSLTWIAELAQSSTDLFTVQDYIAEIFREFSPASFHRLIPTFVWRGIVTTNYDRIVEQAYEISDKRTQRLIPFLSNNDRVDEYIRDKSCLIYLKLHGCITNTHDDRLPLILSADQYAQYRENRSRLFQMFEEWAIENTLIFIGHSIQDPDLRTLLLELTQRIKSRPRYYLIRPNVRQEEIDLWARKNIKVIDSTFESFITELDSVINPSFRCLASKLDNSSPIISRFNTQEIPSPSLLQFLNNEFDYIREDIPHEEGSAKLFYSGFGLGWYPIINDLDVRRKVEQKIIEDVILRNEEDRPSVSELYALKAEAGSGKSVLLKRIAWEASIKAGTLCLFRNSYTPVNFDAIYELANNTRERLFIFIDNSSDNLSLILDILNFSRARNLKITVITAERINEWNVHCETLDEYLVSQYKVPYLSHSEIDELVTLLEKYQSLGPALIHRTHEERIKEFHDRAGRQLLVALHEASHGKPYEDIILDEYQNITPIEAKRLYLSVSVLYRFNVPVRAGLISRIHEIPFNEFKSRLLKPLEHVINILNLPWDDLAYTCRHPEIAQIVFERVLTDSTDRYNEYINLIKGLNPMYSVDNQALRGLIKAKVINEIFPNYEDANAIFELVKHLNPQDAYYLQQRANYERIRSSGNLTLAKQMLEEAIEISPHDISIKHTLSEVLKTKAEKATHRLEREKIRNEAFSVLRKIPEDSTSGKYAAVTKLKLHVDSLKDLMADSSISKKDIQTAIRETEKVFDVLKQRYFEDPYILSLESEYAKLLEDDGRSFEALKEARNGNPRDPYIAKRLSEMLVERNELKTALNYVHEALASNRGDKMLNFIYATLLRKSDVNQISEITYYYKRSFTKWDENYESQFWYARFLYESDQIENIKEAKEIFRHLRNTPFSIEQRTQIKDISGGVESPKVYHGKVLRVEATHGFVTIDGRSDDIFFHKNQIELDTWNRLIFGKRVQYQMGFSLNGPTAIKMTITVES
ncbi:MAG: hypothetical protein GF364_07325 [Candidatus Lokiarchaeota archaeon]|nr:hypothetical protein [Candidatus Lokiarchaeota archaeon]